MSNLRKIVASQIITVLSKQAPTAQAYGLLNRLNKDILVNNTNEINLMNGNLLGFYASVDDIGRSIIPEISLSYSYTVADLVTSLENNKQWKYPVVQCTVRGKQPTTSKVWFNVNAEQFAQDVLSSVISEECQYGFMDIIKDADIKKKHICVEFSSPNIAKPFHAGHLRSTILGHFLANLLTRCAHTVTRINYLGDWGAQFGLLLAAYERFGDANLLEADPMLHLFQLYVKANSLSSEDEEFQSEAKATFSRLENGDPELLALHRKFRELSVAEFKRIYSLLGITFDDYDGEHYYSKSCLPLLEELLEARVIEKDLEDGVPRFQQDTGTKQTVPLLRSDGSTLYITRDLAALKARKDKYDFDEMIYVVDVSQFNYFLGLFELSRKGGLIDPSRQELMHLKFGRVLGMSTRKGEVVFLQDLLREAQTRMLEIMNSKASTKVRAGSCDNAAVAAVLARSAIYIQDMRSRISKDYKFVWEKMLSNESDTGVSLQYTHARLANLVERFSTTTSSAAADVSDTDLLPIAASEPACLLLVHLARYSDIIRCTLEEHEPCYMVKYLFRLCHLVNRCYGQYRISEMSSQDEQSSWLLLYESSRSVLESGLNLLGLPALRHM